MQTRKGILAIALCSVLIILPGTSAFALCGAGSGGGNLDGYEGEVRFFEILTGDLLKLLPRAMGSYLYNNRADFQRGVTFMIRNIESNPLKQKDFEEVRRDAYGRLMRDIPYCVEALKGGELKLDTTPGNLAGRLGMIAYSIFLQKMPTMPDLVYQERVCASFVGSVTDFSVDIWLFYDGYGDFHSLGELMERLGLEGMPEFRHVRNDQFASRVREDPYFMFRYPDKFDRNMIVTSVDMNDLYNSVVNNILDAYVYIWKCSGMDLAHPSYAAPPGTVITRTSRRMGGTQQARERRPSGPSTSATMAPLTASEPTSSGVPSAVIEGAAGMNVPPVRPLPPTEPLAPLPAR
jgi:hypothetical protein